MTKPIFRNRPASASECQAGNQWWLSGEWTRTHYQVADRLIRNIHILPRDRDEDVIQEVALKYPKVIKKCRPTMPEVWLSSLLRNMALTLYRKENLIRPHRGGGGKPKQMANEEFARFVPPAKDGCREWLSLVPVAYYAPNTLSEELMRLVAEHCSNCHKCYDFVCLHVAKRMYWASGKKDTLTKEEALSLKLKSRLVDYVCLAQRRRQLCSPPGPRAWL